MVGANKHDLKDSSVAESRQYGYMQLVIVDDPPPLGNLIEMNDLFIISYLF